MNLLYTVILICTLVKALAQRTDCLTSVLIKKVKDSNIVLLEEGGCNWFGSATLWSSVGVSKLCSCSVWHSKNLSCCHLFSWRKAHVEEQSVNQFSAVKAGVWTDKRNLDLSKEFLFFFLKKYQKADDYTQHFALKPPNNQFRLKKNWFSQQECHVAYYVWLLFEGKVTSLVWTTLQ